MAKLYRSAWTVTCFFSSKARRVWRQAFITAAAEIGRSGSRPGNSQCLGASRLPVSPEQLEQLGREHDVAILAAFVLVDAEDHALAVDVLDPRGGDL